MNMVEKVASVVAQFIQPLAYEDLPEHRKAVFPRADWGKADMLEIARGAIEAMREPTEAMIREGFERIWNCEVYCRDDPLHTIEMQTTAGKTSWQAMIDKALEEQ